ncbi:hypothetical protein SPSYN_01405 [Sporotomaculum syntrophicum]|uniref:Thoeris anti-defense 2-like domain-containing protein n=1 Tax=Sporotomaculum syntrophicum TaxID=182264 RepID=A0A9D2WPX0_9FIRM|nr:MW1434 family type I TA system toxin [Sporotomaculum syntrophicum]KAF1085269.1 hypothetical protein SPSYN_01405 [Sporotomaculum syntrophicum]
MEKYTGVKLVEAEPMSLKEAEQKLNLTLKPTNEAGYIVKYPDGFDTWMPKWEFEQTFFKLANQTFALALDAILHGEKVVRTSWNTKEEWLELITSVQGNSADLEKSDTPSVLPFIGKRVSPYRFVPWTPNMDELLAKDWTILKLPKKGKQPGSH